MKSLKNDFPDVVKITSLGKTFEKRNITLMTLDARMNLIEHGDKLFQKERKDYKSKPAIVLTGQIHSREAITSSMVLFTALKLIHGGLVHNDKRYQNLLAVSKYYIIPSINVDGVNFIEQKYRETGLILPKRTSMHFRHNVVETDYKTGELKLE
jgi:murein tripeptide amidase MpaA